MKRLTLFQLFVLAGLLPFPTNALPPSSAWDVYDVLYPSLHITGAAGSMDKESEDLARAHHDPSREDGTIQGIEAALSLHALDYLEGYATVNFSYGASKEWEDEWEEAFLKLAKLPLQNGGTFEARGGRMLARFGHHNATHLHSWKTVDAPLPVTRLLGEDGLSLEGGDLTWYPGNGNLTALTVAYGEARAHEHAHAEEEAHAEEAGFGSKERLFVINALKRFQPDDFNRYDLTASYAGGDNRFGHDTDVFGTGLSYLWRENGLEPGGRQLEWTTECFYRDVEMAAHGEEEEHAEDEHGEEDHHEDEAVMISTEGEFGIYSQAIFGFNDTVEAGLRLDYVEGSDMLGSASRTRVSPLATVYLPGQQAHLRLQYNYDDLEQGQEAHSFWAQLQISLGGKEVR